jgi:hypothetical protein
MAMLRIHARWLVQMAAFGTFACGGTTNGSTPDAGSADAPSTVVMGASAEAGSGSTPDAAACAALSSTAASAVVAAIKSASADLACASDSDCTTGPAGSDCTAACSGPITT